MNKLRVFFFVGSSVALSSGLVLVACSSDDNAVTITPDGGADTGGGGGNDSSTDKDTGGKDAGVDANEGGPFDAGLKIDSWARTMAEAMCDYTTRCCFGQTNVPDGGALDGGGTFNRAKCVDLLTEFGFEGSTIDDDAIALGNVTFDQAKGKSCLDSIAALPCSLTGAQLKTTRAVCFGALTGKVTNGQPCRSSIECAPGHYCNPDSDAGFVGGDGGEPGSFVVGKCAPLSGVGGNCSMLETGGPGSNEEINDSLRSEEACSYRGSADTNLRCETYDFDAGAYRPRSEWKCAAQVAKGQGCNSTAWCADGICDPIANYVCASPVTAFSPANCNTFKQ